MRQNRPYGSEGGEQRYWSPTPIGRMRAWRAAFCLDPGLRRDDKVLHSRHLKAPGFFASLRVSARAFCPVLALTLASVIHRRKARVATPAMASITPGHAGSALSASQRMPLIAPIEPTIVRSR